MRTALVLTFLAVLASLIIPAARAEVDAASTLEQLKSLAGTWTGTPEAKGLAAEEDAEMPHAVVHEFEVSAGGTVVMETMSPGTEHEMINMYHVDGDDLVLTHYCAGGNQPKMRLDRDASSPDNLVFDFDGGTNLDPEVDQYIHSANIKMLGEGRMDSRWLSHDGSEPAGEMAFHLTRSDGPN